MKLISQFLSVFILLSLFSESLAEEPQSSGCERNWQVNTLQVQSLSNLLNTQSTLLDNLKEQLAKTQTELAQLKQQVNQKTDKNAKDLTSVTSDVTSLKQKVNHGVWPSGHYCILSSGGSCPAGFSRSSGHMRAINMYASSYVSQATFGDSRISCHGKCGQYGNWVADFYMSACCK